MPNFDTDKFQAWAAKGHWTNWERRPAQTEDLRHLVVCALRRLKEGEQMGTTQLVDQVLPGLDDIGRAYITVGFNYLRKHNLLDGCFIRGAKNPRTFGNPSIIWMNPDFYSDGTEGLEGLL